MGDSSLVGLKEGNWEDAGERAASSLLGNLLGTSTLFEGFAEGNIVSGTDDGDRLLLGSVLGIARTMTSSTKTWTAESCVSISPLSSASGIPRRSSAEVHRAMSRVTTHCHSTLNTMISATCCAFLLNLR